MIEAPGGGTEGTWRDAVYCPDNSFVDGYRMRVEPASDGGLDHTAQNSVEMSCKGYDGSPAGTIISHSGFWGNWYNYVYCGANTPRSFMNGYQMLIGSWKTGAHGMKSVCLYKEEIEAPGKYTFSSEPGTWKTWGMCWVGTAICGFQVKMEDQQGNMGASASKDDSALNDVRVACCKLCDPADSLFFDGNDCSYCHYTCKTCKGKFKTDCLSCYFDSGTHAHKLVNNACVRPTYEYEFTFEEQPTGWITNPATTSLVDCGIFKNVMGGYKVFGKDSYAKKNFTFNAPYFGYRINIRLLKVDSWDYPTESDLIYTYITNILRKYSPSQRPYDSVYTGNQCGSASYAERSFVVPFEFFERIDVFEVYLNSSFNSPADDEAWGFSHLWVRFLKCHPTCRSCSDHLSTSCGDCHDTLIKQANGSCSCEPGNFLVAEDACTTPVCAKCYSCNSACKTCFGPFFTDCQSCNDGYVLSGTNCVIICNNLQWVMTVNNMCIDACFLNEYGDLTDNRKCKPCHSSCESCSGPAATNCLTCTSPSLLKQNQCLNSCGSGYYADTTANLCKACPSTCTDCTSATTCTACIAGATKSGGNCVVSCLVNQYFDGATITCKTCNLYCLTCSGGNDNNCLSCDSTLYFDSDAHTCKSACVAPKFGSTTGATKTCVTNCPDSYFASATTRTCQACSTSCLTCNGGTATDCLSCKSSLYLEGTKCVSNCNSINYLNSVDRTCLSCDLSCDSCSGPGPSSCLSCDTTLYFDSDAKTCKSKCLSPKYGYNSPSNIKTCVTPCPNGYFPNDSTRACDLCSANCATCKGGTDTDCLTCKSSFYFEYSKCVTSCSLNKYLNSIDRTCLNCDVSCATCSGPANNNCLSCNSMLYFDNTAHTCRSICISPNYGITSATNIKTCESGCPASFYPLDASRTCEACSAACLTCKGGTDSDCLTCKNSLVLSNNMCVNSCSSSKYLDSVDQTCKICETTCSACSGPDKGNCLSCQTNLFYDQDAHTCKPECQLPKHGFTEGSINTCVGTCPDGFYLNESKNMCEICSSSCKTCKGLSDADCLSCKAPLYFEKFKCVKECGPSTYLVFTNRTCSDCDKSCATCSGAANDSCLSCSADKLFVEKVCSSNCGIIKEGNCVDCSKPCSGCSKYLTNCTSCENDFKLITSSSGNNTCQRKCDVECLKCLDERLCFECLRPNYYIETISVTEAMCRPKKKISATLVAISSPKIFQLRFSDYWPQLLDNFTNNTSLFVSKLSADNYTCQIAKENNDGQTFSVKCNYKTNVTADSILSVLISGYPPVDDKGSKFLKGEEKYEIALSKYVFCGEGSAWREETQSCFLPIKITPLLYLTQEPLTITYTFSNIVPSELDLHIGLNAKISIPTFNKSFYSAEITRIEPSLYNIVLNYSGQVKGHPTLYVDLDLSPELRSNDTLVFTTYRAQINVMDYYFLTPESEKSVKKSADLLISSSSGADQVFIGSNFVNAGSSFAIKSLVVNQIIHLMRFVNINYPPNVLAIYKSKLGKAITPEFNIEEEKEDRKPEGKFHQYKLSSYVLNNCGSYLLICFGLVCLALFFKSFEDLVSRIFGSNNIVFKIYGFFYEFMVWNFPLAFFLAKYQTISLLVGVSLRFPATMTTKGYSNFFFALISALYTIGVPILIYYQIRRMRKYARFLAALEPLKDVSRPRGTFQAKPKGDRKSLKVEELTIAEPPSEKNVNNSESIKGSPVRMAMDSAGVSTAMIHGEEDRLIMNKSVNNHHDLNETDSSLKNSRHIEKEVNNEALFISPVKLGKLDFTKGEAAENDELREFFSQTKITEEIRTQKKPEVPEEVISNQLIKETKKKRISFLDRKSNLIRNDLFANVPELKEKSYSKGMRWGELVKFFKQRTMGVRQNTLNFLRKSQRKLSSLFKPTVMNQPFNLEKLKKNFKVLHTEYNMDKAYKHYFMFFEIIRQLCISSIILIFEDWPFPQTVLVTLVNIIFFLTTIIIRPYSTVRSFLQNIITEALLLSACFGFLTLAVMDRNENNDFDQRMKVGWWICYSNLAIIVFMLVMLGLQILIILGKLGGKLMMKCLRPKSNKIRRKS